MAATLLARDLAAGHGARSLFDSLDLTVGPGDVVGLVGANGAGKSTLLRLLAGLDTPEEGTVTLTPADASVGWLPQEPDRVPGESVSAFLARRTGVAEAQGPAPSGRWTRPPTHWQAATPARTTPTRRRWTAGWTSVPRTWRTGSPRWLPTWV